MKASDSESESIARVAQDFILLYGSFSSCIRLEILLPADWKSAILQSKTLRYGFAAPS
jgi:hypothetical protein